MDDFPLIEFVTGTLAIELQERDQYLSDVPSIELIALHGYSETKEVARSLVERFESLPWKYTLSLKLPTTVSEIFSRFVTEIPLSGKVRLVRPSKEFIDRFPLKSEDERRHKRIYGGGGLLAIREDPQWDEDAVYLQIDASGFIDMYGLTMPATNAKALFRGFVGLGVAVRLFQIEPTYETSLWGHPKSHVLVHKRIDDRWEIDGKFDLEDRNSTTFNALKLHDLDGQLSAAEQKAQWAMIQLSDMQNAFSETERGSRIVRAAQWLFDSYTGQDELLSFVQSMVVIEILLGEKQMLKEIGLGELLRNRCAYLVGKSHTQRDQIMQDFDEIYRVRSQIVHSGKSRLKLSERSLFHKLRWLCRRVIQQEVDLLKADLKQSQ